MSYVTGQYNPLQAKLNDNPPITIYQYHAVGGQSTLKQLPPMTRQLSLDPETVVDAVDEGTKLEQQILS